MIGVSQIPARSNRRCLAYFDVDSSFFRKFKKSLLNLSERKTANEKKLSVTHFISPILCVLFAPAKL